MSIKRNTRNIGKSVIYTTGPRKGRVTSITGFRGDFSPGIPNVTLTDGNSVPGNVLAYHKEKANEHRKQS